MVDMAWTSRCIQEPANTRGAPWSASLGTLRSARWLASALPTRPGFRTNTPRTSAIVMRGPACLHRHPESAAASRWHDGQARWYSTRSSSPSNQSSARVDPARSVMKFAAMTIPARVTRAGSTSKKYTLSFFAIRRSMKSALSVEFVSVQERGSDDERK